MRASNPGTRRLWYATVAVLVVVAGVIALVSGSSEKSAPATAAQRSPISHRATPRQVTSAQPTKSPQNRPTPAGRVSPRSHSNVSRMLGQMIVARFQGSAPSASFLARVKQGQIGGVILFSDNVQDGVTATRALTTELQRAAREGGNPPLLVMTDQEGGEVKRLSGPPDLAPAAMSSRSVAFRQGAATGHLLRSAGVNLDLAPVADVERVRGSFLGTRSFGRSPALVASRACAFAQGLSASHVAYTLKHFPGLGRASGNTDLEPVSVNASPPALRSDYAAYRACGADPDGLVMISSAIYPELSGHLPAVMSPEIYLRELPRAVSGNAPVTISDDLQSASIGAQTAPARHAIDAGLDLLMYAQTEQASDYAYSKLLADVRSGSIPVDRLVAADRKILALKHRLG